jgi:hypothetical protein
VRTSNSPAEFAIALKQPPTKVFLDTSSVLARRK